MILRFFLLASIFLLAFCSVPERDNPKDPDGVNYINWVVIGTQTWHKYNLNVDVGTGSKCYNDYEANCTKYGRLYDWATAMALDSSCNSTNCSGQIQQKHRGICPEGWHIPSKAEMDVLISYVENTQGCTDCAAKHLKGSIGWGEYEGFDTYGFSAIGLGDGLGVSSSLWSSDQSAEVGYTNVSAYLLQIGTQDSIHWNNKVAKRGFCSVRCLKN